MLFRRGVIFMTCCSIMIYIYSGCTSTRFVSVPDYQIGQHPAISKVIMKDGSVYEFDVENYRPGVLQRDEIVGFLRESNELKRIPISEVQSVCYTEPDSTKSLVLVVGIVAGAAVLIFAWFAWAFEDSLHDLVRGR